jgi:hypothetical protein
MPQMFDQASGLNLWVYTVAFLDAQDFDPAYPLACHSLRVDLLL